MAKKGRPPSSSYSINGPAAAVSTNPAASHPANASTANPKQARPDTTASSYIHQSEYGYYDQRSEDVRFTSTEGGDGRSEDVRFEESADDHMRFTQADERFGYGEQYSQEGGYGDEEESEDEDVFAFLPPTTAEQEEERRQAELAAAQQQQSHFQSQSQTFQQISTTRTVAPKAEFAHSPFAFSASTPPPASANDNATNNNRYSSNNPYTMFGYSPHNAYDNNDGYSSQEDIRPTTAAGRPTTSAGLRGVGVMQSHPSLVSAPSFSFSVAGSVSTAGGNGIGLAPALPITSTSTMPNANASSPGVAYPDPTFDPWGRSSAALASPGRASNNPYYSTTNVGPRPDTAYSYTTNPYSIPNRSTAAAGSGIRYPHPPPLSPPSPSTDSHPSTAGGLSQLAAGGGAGPNAPEQFKLRRLNTGAAPASGPPKSGLREETERDVVDGQAVEMEEDEEVGVEEVEVGAGAAAAATRLGGGKAVRVSLPGVVAPSRKSASIGRRSTSVHDNGKRESRDSDTLADADLGDGKDLDGDVLDSPIKPFSGVADAAQVVKRRHNHHNSKARHSSKRYSTVPGTPLTPHTPGTPGGPSSAGGAGSSGFGYSTAVAGVNGAGQGYKTKNPNAQPYYAYAGLARDGGYPYPASSSHAQGENGGATVSGSEAAAATSATARAVMTAANTSANGGYGISKESRKKRRSRKKSHRSVDADADSMKGGDLDLERGDASSIVKAGVVGDEDAHDEGLHQYEEYGYENGKRSSGRRRRRKDKDRAMEEDRDSLASVSTRASGSVLPPHEQSHSHSRSRSRSRPRTYATTTEEGGYEGDYGSAEYVGGQPYGKGYPYGSGERGPYGRGDGDGGYDGDEGSTTRDSAYWEEGSESESEESIKMEFDFDAIEEEDSPFPEVRASVSNIDDPDMPAMTIRMWFVGLILCMTSSALNVFFNFRSPAPTIVPLALLLVSYPFGKFLAFTLPITSYRIPLPYLPRFFLPLHQPSFAPFRLIVNILLPLTYPRSLEFSLNPGPWNIKEHVLVYIMANVSTNNPYALNAIVVSEVFYNIRLGYWFALTLVLATQLTGFGLAGLCRRFLVWPASMVWPQNLVACTLLNTLHAEDEDDGIGMYGLAGGKGMSRYKFFVITTTASFVFFFLPGYLFEALSVFSFVCWAAPNNIPVNQLFGVRTGLGMSILTFDWTQISWIGSPLMVPWWAEVHIFIGFVLFYWIMTPILYYTNSWNLAYFPISANEPYDRFGDVYNVTRVLRNNDTFDEAAYNAYSPLFLPATYAVTYLLAFALSTCVIVHTLLYHGHTLLNGVKKIKVEADDIHAKLMRNYPEVPDWWYGMSVAVFFALAVVAVEVWNTGVPVWALLLSIILPIVYILPSGFIYAMTGQGITLNILAQIIPGTLLPGNPLANMVFKAYSVQTLSAGTSFVQDLKLGHYVKVPPRATFMVQMIATVIAAFIQVGTKEWIFTNVHDICTDNQPSQLTCPHNQVFFTASAVWGLIGPARQFGTGTIYHPHLYAIVIGAFLPLPFFFWQRRYPKSWVRYVSIPVILNGVSFIPPATGINYSSWFAVGIVFQYIIRKKNFAWWSKFNYVLSSALDSGTVISVMVIFFTLQFPRQGSIQLNWWGNTVHTETADWNRKRFLDIPAGGVPWKGFPPAQPPS